MSAFFPFSKCHLPSRFYHPPLRSCSLHILTKNPKHIPYLSQVSVNLEFIRMGGFSKYDLLKPVIEWVDIPSGNFLMGSPLKEMDRVSDEIQHPVTLNGFKISKYPITFQQYDKFCEATSRRKPEDEGWGRDNRPVINVNWHDAQAFASWMNSRLPSEAEWEYACRAGTNTPFHTGNSILSLQANINEIPSGNNPGEFFQGKTIPVGQYLPNKWGLYDMHGNVLEWCLDWYGEYTTDNQANFIGADNGNYRVLRGGCWSLSSKYCRSAHRSDREPLYRFCNIGFRIVSLQPWLC